MADGSGTAHKRKARGRDGSESYREIPRDMVVVVGDSVVRDTALIEEGLSEMTRCQTKVICYRGATLGMIGERLKQEERAREWRGRVKVVIVHGGTNDIMNRRGNRTEWNELASGLFGVGKVAKAMFGEQVRLVWSPILPRRAAGDPQVLTSVIFNLVSRMKDAITVFDWGLVEESLDWFKGWEAKVRARMVKDGLHLNRAGVVELTRSMAICVCSMRRAGRW